MTDIKAWVDEHRAIHAAATGGPWAKEQDEAWGENYPSLSIQRVGESWDSDPAHACCDPLGNENVTAIVDAHNVTVPTALSMIEAVLAVLDDPGGPDSWSHTFQGRHSVFADDVRDAMTDALEGVIDGE